MPATRRRPTDGQMERAPNQVMGYVMGAEARRQVQDRLLAAIQAAPVGSTIVVDEGAMQLFTRGEYQARVRAARRLATARRVTLVSSRNGDRDVWGRPCRTVDYWNEESER